MIKARRYEHSLPNFIVSRTLLHTILTFLFSHPLCILFAWHHLTHCKMPFNVLNWMHAVFEWIGNGLLPLVSLSLLFSCAGLCFFKIKAGILRLAMPGNGGAMVERWWVDDHGNPSWYRVVLCVG